MIKIYYCNWDTNKENIKALLGNYVEFNDNNYKLIETETITLPSFTDDELERMISDTDSYNVNSVDKLFIDILNKIFEKYNDNPNHNFRSMCVGDVIQLVGNNYTVNYLVDTIGFKII